MSKLPRITGKKLAKVVEKFGFIHSHTTRNHMVFKHPDGRTMVIPVHSGEEIGPGLLNKIIKKDLGVTKEDFMEKL